MERTMSFPERELHYQHEVKSVKNINIRIRPDMTVYVSSNPQIELSEVEKILSETDINSLSPMQAFLLVSDLVDKVKNNG